MKNYSNKKVFQSTGHRATQKRMIKTVIGRENMVDNLSKALMAFKSSIEAASL